MDEIKERYYNEEVDNVQVEQEEPQKTSFFEKKTSTPQPVARKKTAMNDASVCIFKPVSIDEQVFTDDNKEASEIHE